MYVCIERILKNFHVIHVQPTAGQIMYYLKCIVIQWLTFEEKTNKQKNKTVYLFYISIWHETLKYFPPNFSFQNLYLARTEMP